MFRLLKIELSKLWPYRAFKVLFIIYLVLMGLTLAGGAKIGNSDGGLTPEKILGFPNIWNYYTLYACYFNVIIAMLVIFISGNEYSNRTSRQNIIDGLTRNESVAAKVLLITALAVINTIFLFISGSIGGFIYSTPEMKADWFGHTGFIFAYFIQTFGLLSLGYLLATIFRKTGMAVIVFLLFLFPVDVIIRASLGINGDFLPVGNYFLKMVPFPVEHALSGGEEPTPLAPTMQSLMVGAGYAVLFNIISLLVIRKRDL